MGHLGLLLENGEGIGDAEEVRQLLAAENFDEVVEILNKLRLMVLRPETIIYQRQP